MQWETAFDPLIACLRTKFGYYNDDPMLLGVTVTALILEHPSGSDALDMWDALGELQKELSQVEIHDRVWGSEHTTLVANIKDHERRFADLMTRVIDEVIGACLWVTPGAQA